MLTEVSPRYTSLSSRVNDFVFIQHVVSLGIAATAKHACDFKHLSTHWCNEKFCPDPRSAKAKLVSFTAQKESLCFQLFSGDPESNNCLSLF